MGVRQPGVDREQGHLDGEGEGERCEQPTLRSDRQVEAHEIGERESRGSELLAVGEGKRDDPGQHQRRPERGVDEELDGGVDASLAAPDPDDEVHRDQDRLEEHEEDEEVEREEDTDHPGLQQQRVDDELLAFRLDRGRGSKRNRHQKSGEHHHRHGNAIDSQGPADPPGLIPGDVLGELVPGHRLEDPEDIAGQSERKHRQRDAQGQMQLPAPGGHQRNHDGSDRRKEDQPGQHLSPPSPASPVLPPLGGETIACEATHNHHAPPATSHTTITMVPARKRAP